MKVAVVGSRNFSDYALLERELDKIENITEIISGGATGADSLAEKYAITHSIPIKVFKPNWEKYGKRAGFLRNSFIIKTANLALAFWNGKSKGTKYSIDLCFKYHVILKIIKFGGKYEI